MKLLAQTAPSIDEVAKPIADHGLAVGLVVLAVFALFCTGLAAFFVFRAGGKKVSEWGDKVVEGHRNFLDATVATMSSNALVLAKQGEQLQEATDGIMRLHDAGHSFADAVLVMAEKYPELAPDEMLAHVRAAKKRLTQE